MSLRGDPPRLREFLDRTDPLATALEDGRYEVPSEEQLRQVAVGVRLALGGLPPNPGGASGGSGQNPNGAGGSVRAASSGIKGPVVGAKVISSVVLPLVMGAFSGGAVLLTATHFGNSKIERASSSVNAKATASRALPAPPRLEEAVTPAAPDATPIVEPPSAVVAPAAPPLARTTLNRKTTRDPAPPTSGDNPGPSGWFAENAPPASEFDLLAPAQQAVERDPWRALALANEHERRFAAGNLAQEREVIAISALLRLGRTREAESRAARFHAQFPHSAHRRRIDVLLQTGSP